MFFSWLLGTVAGVLFPWLLATGSVAGAVGLAAFRAGAAAMGGPATLTDPDLEEIQRFEPSILSCRGELLDVAAEARRAMEALRSRADRSRVRMEVAVTPGLEAWMDPRAFRKLLVEMLAQAIDAAPCGRVLVTAAPHGGRVQIGVTHDGFARSRESLEGTLRPVSQIAALSGGTFEVVGRAGQAATVLVRLPEPVAHPATSGQAQPTGGSDRAQPSVSHSRAAQRTPETMVSP